jgi:uroporphyrinogen decarboxylase
MQPLTSYERVRNTFNHQPIDQVACHDSLWSETLERWKREGAIAPDTADGCNQVLGMDFGFGGSVNAVADLDFHQVIEETEETRLTRDGNGAMFRQHKKHTSCPEHVGFAVSDRAPWEALIKPHLLKVNRRRIDPDGYRAARQKARDRQQYFSWWGAGPFEMMQSMCGHENLLMGFADDPEWAKDMMMTYSRLIIMHLETLFAEAGRTDGFTMGDDLGYKGKPFMSPAMYREIIFPGHKLIFDWAHSHGMPVAVHSCGFVEPLVPAMVEAGMDFLQAMEVKAGMDIRHFMPDYTARLGFWGNIDARALIANDRAWIDSELETKVAPLLRAGGAYIMQSDHTIPPQVDFATMQYFFERGREMSRKIFAGA